MRLLMQVFVVMCLGASSVAASEATTGVTAAWWFPDRSGQVEIYEKEGVSSGEYSAIAFRTNSTRTTLIRDCEAVGSSEST